MCVCVCVCEGVRKSVCEREGARPLLKHILHQWAGVSGVIAAKTLYDGGITDFIILEASDRIGGRIRAVDFAGVKVEKGANWIQGLNRSHPESHPLWPLVPKSTALIKRVFAAVIPEAPSPRIKTSASAFSHDCPLARRRARRIKTPVHSSIKSSIMDQ